MGSKLGDSVEVQARRPKNFDGRSLLAVEYILYHVIGLGVNAESVIQLTQYPRRKSALTRTDWLYEALCLYALVTISAVVKLKV